MKENLPNLAKGVDFQEVQEAQRVPKKLDPRRNTPRHIVITFPKITEKERILQASREKDTVTYKGFPINCQLYSQKRPSNKKGLARSIQSHERQGPTSRITVSSKTFI